MEEGGLFPTSAGTPQGGIASPLLANLTLDGLEAAIQGAIRPRRDKVNLIRYADDFIVTAARPEILQEQVKFVIVRFLAERGLRLSEEKTILTHILASWRDVTTEKPDGRIASAEADLRKARAV